MSQKLNDIIEHLQKAGRYVKTAEGITEQVKDREGNRDLRELREKIQEVEEKFKGKGR